MGLARRLGEVDIRTEDGIHTVTCIFGAPSAAPPAVKPARPASKSKPAKKPKKR
jgi:hypothetical protein